MKYKILALLSIAGLPACYAADAGQESVERQIAAALQEGNRSITQSPLSLVTSAAQVADEKEKEAWFAQHMQPAGGQGQATSFKSPRPVRRSISASQAPASGSAKGSLSRSTPTPSSSLQARSEALVTITSTTDEAAALALLTDQQGAQRTHAQSSVAGDIATDVLEKQEGTCVDDGWVRWIDEVRATLATAFTSAFQWLAQEDVVHIEFVKDKESGK